MKKSQLKIMTILGTRPEIIRLSRVIACLNQNVNHILVHTGQNYDFELNEIFFKQLDLPNPDYYLEVDTSSLGKVLGQTIIKTEQVIKEVLPDAVLILGDTNSSIAGIIAKRLKIPIYHMEAGNRCFDLNVPEETNRRIIDHIADFNLVYTEHARRNLISEGISQRRIYLTGSPMYEVLMYHKENINSSSITNNLNLKKKEYFIVSIHREENVDNLQHLSSILEVLNILAEEYKLPIIVSTHPRTRKRLEQLPEKKINETISFLKPFGFFDYVNLQMNALCALSDSGTISEESAILSFPAITIRNAMERPEAIDSGTIILTGMDSQTILDSVAIAVRTHKNNQRIPADYLVTDTSLRVLKLIIGTAKLSNLWHGVNKNNYIS